MPAGSNEMQLDQNSEDRTALPGEQALRSLALRLRDTVLPARCMRCDQPVVEDGALCAGCWGEVHFITDPLCTCCGKPFDFAAGENVLCGECVARAPLYAQARSLFVYNAGSRGLVTRYKYGDRTDRAPAFTKWMGRLLEAFEHPSDLIVPVPLHRWRLLSRRFNQSALIGRYLARDQILDFAPDLLVRTRNTRQQVGLSQAQRKRNVSNAFTVKSGQSAALEGRNVLLVDDVMTSGATVEACCRTLIKAGAKNVNVVTLGRVVDAR